LATPRSKFWGISVVTDGTTDVIYAVPHEREVEAPRLLTILIEIHYIN
jgi:hypothetical protein